MPSVQEIKDELIAEVAATGEVSKIAIGAIDTLLNISTNILTFLGIFLAVLALFGVVAIARGARRSSERMANK